MTKKIPLTVDDHTISHPDRTLERLLDGMRTKQDGARMTRVSARLEILHQLCREQYETGNRDFSMRALSLSFANRGGPKSETNAISKLPYRPLIQAWAAFAGGHTQAPSRIRRDQERQRTVRYIDAHFRLHGRVPSWDKLQQDCMATLVRSTKSGVASEAARQRHVHACVKAWQQAWLADVPEQLVVACDQLFNLMPSIPTEAAVRAALDGPDAALDNAQLNAGIERWRRCRLALEIWAFAPSRDESGFRWLALHAELAEWQPMVADYLTSLVSDYVRKTARLAIQAFFADYLLAYGLPLTPQEFLRKGYIPPSFADVCLKGLSSQEVDKRWRAIHWLLKHVLDRGEGFVTVDSHGHRVTSPEYQNTLPPLPRKRRQPSKRAGRARLPAGSLQDPELSFLTDLNPQLEQWRVYAVGWLASVKVNLSGATTAVRQFIGDYIVGKRLPTDPSVLLSLKWQRQNELPGYCDTALRTMKSKHVGAQFAKAVEFIDYVLGTHYSAEDDFGRRTVSGDYNNFLLAEAEEVPRHGAQATHSNKDVLPSRYIRYLRELICPDGSRHFRDFAWAHNAVALGDWFEVHPDMIDKLDPDCVWRMRDVVGKEGSRRLGKNRRRAHEIWSPVRSIALMIKLELPLRTFQVRMLDSGEADTWRYEGSMLEKNRRGEWVYRAGEFRKNTSPLVSNIGKTERHAGVFRRMPDAISGKVFAGLHINTNKTQDRGKDQWDRGYVVPWQHGKVLYWCERLRNWQEKYSPVDRLLPCSLLPQKVLGIKSNMQKQQMGSMSFLFRDSLASSGETAWPITDAKLGFMWDRALNELEDICVEKGHTAVDGSRLQFVVKDGLEGAAFVGRYSLHSLRVSLITHLATEGGVEMHILSECIAGHARILMTLYYKKSGVVYVSEAMEAATARLKAETVEQQNWIRWMKEASLKQLEVSSATVDLSVLQAVKDALSRGGVSLLRTNLGLCAKGGMGCDNGGIIVDDETGAVSFRPTPGYPQQKNCVRCRWFLTGPAFLQALVHHWNLLHFNLGDSGHRYLEMSEEVAELESAMLDCQRLNLPFEHEARLENLQHALTVVYDGNEKLAADSLATMKLIVRCKHIIDAAKEHDSGVVLVAVGGVEEVTINVRECNELEQVMTAALGSTIYVDEDAGKAVLKAGNAFDRMLVMNGKDPVFFNLSEKQLPVVVSHMTRLLQAYAGSIGRAVPFVEGVERLSALGLFGETDEILRLASAGRPLHLSGSDEQGPVLVVNERKVIQLELISDTVMKGE